MAPSDPGHYSKGLLRPQGSRYIGEKVSSPDAMAALLNDLARTTSGHKNYGVAAAIIDKKTHEIVSLGLNSVTSNFHFENVDYHHAYTDGHAEMNALRDFYRRKEIAYEQVKNGDMTETEWKRKFNPDNYELWTNLQPCRMCECAICKSGIKTRYIALDDIVEPIANVYAGPQNQEIYRELQSRVQLADGILDGAYAGQEFDNASHADDAVKPFDDTKKEVRAVKEAKETQRGAYQIDIGALITRTPPQKIRTTKKKILENIKSIVPDWETVFGHRTRPDAPIDNTVIQMLAQRAIRSEKKGNARNAAAAIDPFGTVWFVVGDHTGQQNPLRTPLMRAMKRVENILEITPPDIRKQLPRPGQFTYVSFKEPDMMEAARAAALYPQRIVYLTADREHGVVSTGQLGRMGDFYLQARGLEKAIAKEPAIGPTEMDSIIKNEQSVSHAAKVAPSIRHPGAAHNR